MGYGSFRPRAWPEGEVCPSIVPTLVSQTGVVVLFVAAVAAVAVVVAVAAFVATGLGQASRSHPCTETCTKFCTTKATGPAQASKSNPCTETCTKVCAAEATGPAQEINSSVPPY